MRRGNSCFPSSSRHTAAEVLQSSTLCSSWRVPCCCNVLLIIVTDIVVCRWVSDSSCATITGVRSYFVYFQDYGQRLRLSSTPSFRTHVILASRSPLTSVDWISFIRFFCTSPTLPSPSSSILSDQLAAVLLLNKPNIHNSWCNLRELGPSFHGQTWVQEGTFGGFLTWTFWIICELSDVCVLSEHKDENAVHWCVTMEGKIALLISCESFSRAQPRAEF